MPGNVYSSDVRSPQYLPLEARWCLPIGECLLLEIADTIEEKRIGLMERSLIHSGTGMWFQFSPAEIVRFWMHKTYIPLDIVFLSEGLIVAIEKSLKPCFLSPCKSYGPNKLVDSVIELEAGAVERLGIKVGDFVNIEYISGTSKDIK